MRLLVIFAIVCAGFSQTRPDFSGSWKLNVAKSDIQEPRLKGAVYKIDHHEPQFVISRTLLYSGDAAEMKFALRTDGEPVNVPYGEERLVLRLRWDDGSLICSIRDIDASDDTADRVRYSLSPDGKTLTVTEHGSTKPNVWVFERQ